MSANRKHALLLCASSALALSFAQSAFAQAQALEEVIVTARRTEERLQSVPVAVTALTQSNLRDKAIQNYQDLQYSVPSMTFSQTVTRDSNRVTIRGQTTAYGSNLPSVETLFSEVPQTTSGANRPLYDLQSVQVLKGPQGVAFGRNSTGGAVLITPQRPSYVFEGYLYGLAGNFNAYTLEAVVNLPLVTDKLAVRGSFHIERRDGWTKNLITGTDLDDKNLDAGRLSVLFEPTERFENLTVVSYQQQDQTGTSNHILSYNPAGQVGTLYRNAAFYPGSILVPGTPRFNIDQEAALGIALGRDQIRSDFDGYTSNWSLLVANTSILRLSDNLRLKNILGVQRNGGEGTGTDMDGMPFSIITLGNNRNLGDGPTTQRITNEIQLQGEAMDGKLRWLVGYFYLKDEEVDGGKPGYSTTLQDLLVTRASTPTVSFGSSEFKSQAPYGQITVPLSFITPNLSLTVGARHTKDEVTETSLNRTGAAQLTCTPANCVPIVRSAEFEGWGHAVTLDWQVQPDTLIYLAHRRGYKGGGFNRIQVPQNLWVVAPENVDDVEAGFKTDWRLGSMPARTNIAVYNQWYKNIVRSEFVFVNGAATNINRNLARATIRGIEIEQTLIPTPSFELMGTYSYTDAILTDSGGTVPGKPRFPDVPLHKASLTATYNLPTPEAWGAWRVSATASYQSKRAGDQQIPASPQSIHPAYTLLNARLDMRDFLGSGVDVALWGKNLTDEDYVLAGGDFYVASSLGFVQGLYGEPRMYGVEARYAFGGDRAPPPPPPPAPPPPPPAPPPPPPPPPVAYEAREFVVYFPFDQYVLTPEAQQVIAQAADYAKTGNATRVVVVGHADTSGSAAYNVRLSERRAKATADALVGSGLAQTALAVDWKGEAEPAVATGDGVKEPLNRRATININF